VKAQIEEALKEALKDKEMVEQILTEINEENKAEVEEKRKKNRGD